MNSEQDERAAMIEAAKEYLASTPFMNFSSTADVYLAEFTLAQTADLREQLRVARERVELLESMLEEYVVAEAGADC